MIFRCPGGFGLGSALVSISAYAGYCARHGMALALDLRRLPYFADDAQHGFFASFAISAPGLRVVRDLDTVEQIASLPQCVRLPRYRLLSFDQPPPAPIMEIDGVLNRRLAPWYGTRVPEGYAIALGGSLKSTVEAALRGRDWHDVVGIHHRHGNGEILESREDFTTAPDYVVRVDAMAEALIDDARIRAAGRPVFVAGDNRDFVARALAAIPNSFSLLAGIWDVPIMEHLRADPERGLREAATDLWALATCREVVCVSSGFTEAAALINPALRLHVHDALKLGNATALDGALHAARVHVFYRPDYPPTWRALADVLGRAGDGAGAGACEATAQDVASGVLNGVALNDAVRRVARLDAVVERLKASLHDGASEANATRQFASRLLATGYADLAIALVEAVLPGHAGDGRLWRLAALVYDKLERLADAEAAARRAITLLSGEPQTRMILARILQRRGDPRAKEELKAAAAMLKQVKTDPPPP